MERRTAAAATLGAPGFTFIEVILVLFVIALAAAVAGPVIGRTAEGMRMRTEVAGFSATLRHAREQAVATQRPHRVEVNPVEHRLSVIAEESDVRLTRSLARQVTIAAMPPQALTVTFEPHGVSSGGDFRLGAGAIFYLVSVDPLTGRVRVSRQ
jgi:prepilin-type N-terminal cleavage/methylation domain-containing protein